MPRIALTQSDTAEVSTSDTLSKQMDSIKINPIKKSGLMKIIEFEATDSMVMDFNAKQAYYIIRQKLILQKPN